MSGAKAVSFLKRYTGAEQLHSIPLPSFLEIVHALVTITPDLSAIPSPAYRFSNGTISSCLILSGDITRNLGNSESFKIKGFANFFTKM